jgi:hypothetical protein
MKTKIPLAAVVTILTLWTGSAPAQVRVLNDRTASRILDQLQEVDFEDLPFDQRPGDPGLPNPLTLEGVTFRDRFSLRSGFSSSPTCEADPDNPQGGNISLFLNPGGDISFAQAPRVVVLDIQGIRDNPFVLVVTDGRGRRKKVASQGELFGVTRLGVAAPSGIASVDVQSVGGTGGPLALARVLFTENIR